MRCLLLEIPLAVVKVIDDRPVDLVALLIQPAHGVVAVFLGQATGMGDAGDVARRIVLVIGVFVIERHPGHAAGALV